MPYTHREKVGYQAVDTSLGAALDIAPKAPVLRAQILTLLRQHGGVWSSEDISARLGIDYCNVQPRISELRNSGLIEDSGIRHLSKFNKPIIAWRITRKDLFDE